MDCRRQDQCQLCEQYRKWYSNGNANSNANSNAKMASLSFPKNSIRLGARMDENKKAAVSTVGSESLKKAKEQVPSSGKNGAKTVGIEISEVKGAQKYELEIPSDALRDSESNIVYEITTSVGKITIPSGMLSNTNVNTNQVSVSIGRADVSALNDKMQEKIGDRPFLELHVQSGGEIIAWNNPKAPVTITTAYTPSANELKHPEKIVVWYIDAQGEAQVIKINTPSHFRLRISAYSHSPMLTKPSQTSKGWTGRNQVLKPWLPGRSSLEWTKSILSRVWKSSVRIIC